MPQGCKLPVLLALMGFVGLPVIVAAAEPEPAPSIDFNSQIRPLLSDTCFKCHGPDEKQRQSGLRLDMREAALQPTDSGASAIVPGAPDRSELVRRITSEDPELMMPPAGSGKTLSAAQKELLARWVAAGAEYQRHWAFVPPRRPIPPAVKQEAWISNPIDRFVLARLEREGLAPAPRAAPAQLARRLYLDLTGLPPTPEEVDAFVAASQRDARRAWEGLVDTLLASPHYGERMAVDWLDAARYADTHGYHIDSHRDMWPWREWVIRAFNTNQPFDQFTIEQFAGDLLPNATDDQRLATGFHRNHMINFEGGAIPAEYLNNYIVDRVNTTGTVWLGMSVGCAQCHDHKFDPFTQRDFYSLYAFFNGVPENGLDGRRGNAAPLLRLPVGDQQAKLDELTAKIAALQRRLAEPNAEFDAAQLAWEATAAGDTTIAWTALIPEKLSSRDQESTLAHESDGVIVAGGKNPPIDTYTIVAEVPAGRVTGLRLEALADPRHPKQGPGRSESGNFVLSTIKLAWAPLDSPTTDTVLKFKAASADFNQSGFGVELALDNSLQTGWAISPEIGRSHTAIFELEQPFESKDSALLTVTLDFISSYSQHQIGRLRLGVTSSDQPVGRQQTPAKVAAALAVPREKRTTAQQQEVRDHFRRQVLPAGRTLVETLAQLGKDQQALEQLIPTSMVMQDQPKPRDTFILMRGEYDKPGDRVEAAIPDHLAPWPSDAPRNRLGLARWLVQPDHPLTARVLVNRYWQMVFGIGLVKTAEEFGSQGELPSHPELLDWLATEWVSSGWNVKQLVRLLVTSSSYAQDARVSSSLWARDPENRLLARGPRFRLQAEFIRDAALANGGLLVRTIGGPSVSPYQPAGLWDDLAFGREFTAQKFVQGKGDELYRRSLYTFWKRTVPPTQMAAFDAPDRETCTVRRARTNTPLQALVTLNDPTFVEASRGLATRVLAEQHADDASRLRRAFRLVVAREPSVDELFVLGDLLARQRAAFAGQPESAVKLLSVGERPRDERFEPAELAAWSNVASVLLNLDEALTKG